MGLTSTPWQVIKRHCSWPPRLRCIPGQALPQGSIAWATVNGFVATKQSKDFTFTKTTKGTKVEIQVLSLSMKGMTSAKVPEPSGWNASS